MKLNTYLRFDGDCETAFKFYEQHLGAKITTLSKWGDGPMADQAPVEIRDKVMHAELELDGYVLMGTDGAPQSPYNGITGSHVVISTDKPEDAERIFKSLSEDGEVTMEMEETFWAQRFGMVTDKFAVPWMVNCNKPE